MPKPKAKTASTPPKTLTGLKGWVEVFKAGTHTDSKGRQITFSQADLDQMAANHKLGAAPAVLGHPKHDDPAYAWVEDYKREGDSLFAKFKDIHPAFEKGVESGAYRNRSVSVFKDDGAGWRVRHVGWLGAQAPAIDGLKPVEFACDDDTSMEFTAPGYSLVWGLENVARLLRSLREQMIAKDGIQAADAVLPQWQIDSALQAAADARAEFQEDGEADVSPFHQHNPGGSMFTQADIDAAAAKAKKEAEDASAAQFASQQQELTRLKAEQQKTRVTGLIEGWKTAGLVTPAEEIGLTEFMVALESGEAAEFSFSAADKSQVKKTPIQFFQDFMAGRKPVVKLNPGKNDGGAEDQVVDLTNARAIADAAREFQRKEEAAGRVISIEQAVAKVSAPRG